MDFGLTKSSRNVMFVTKQWSKYFCLLQLRLLLLTFFKGSGSDQKCFTWNSLAHWKWKEAQHRLRDAGGHGQGEESTVARATERKITRKGERGKFLLNIPIYLYCIIYWFVLYKEPRHARKTRRRTGREDIKAGMGRGQSRGTAETVTVQKQGPIREKT